jgi:hypothetical protein
MKNEFVVGTTVAYSECIHKERPHNGQMACAKRLLTILQSEGHPTEIAESHKSITKRLNYSSKLIQIRLWSSSRSIYTSMHSTSTRNCNGHYKVCKSK